MQLYTNYLRPAPTEVIGKEMSKVINVCAVVDVYTAFNVVSLNMLV